MILLAEFLTPDSPFARLYGATGVNELGKIVGYGDAGAFTAANLRLPVCREKSAISSGCETHPANRSLGRR